MRKVVLFLCGIILYASPALALQCFVAKEKDRVIHNEGNCNKQYSPCSTFKIALSLIGYDQGILVDETHPVWHFQEGYPDYIDKWKQEQSPQSWIKNSCVWYSQVLTKQLGIRKFQDYVTKFSYGNMDLSGDKGKNNGLTNSWLSSSLEISSFEQIGFLEKLLKGTLPVRKHANEMTKNILFVEDLQDGWKLYGKTGSCMLLSADRATKLKIHHGWFIGWIEKGDRRIIFSNHIVDDKEENTFAGPRAKADVKERLIKISDNMGDR